ncbi:MAG TPA: Calx-beta domain-containing protein, partial [Gemmataceae bacterium]|nr:Calx-beta domain-containing protein [Gemmataceae bacterium]
SIGGNPLSIAMGDLNADGKLDLVTASRIYVIDGYVCPYYCYSYGHYEGRVNVLLGYGDGSFADVGGATLTSTNPLAVTLGSFNDDSIPDVAVADNDTNDATVLINAGDWILPPKITINDVTVTEGDSGTVDATFTVSLSFSTTHTVTVDYSTVSGTATDGQDYTGVTNPLTLTFDPGQTSKQITIQVKGDLIDEYDENFYVFLSNATVGQITDGQGVGTIVDNDPPPTLKINDVSITEGKRGTKLLTFTVTLTGLTEKYVSVNYATADGTAKTSDHDYQATSGTLYFAPGQTTATFSVVIFGDSRKEPNETFSVNLSGASEATILDGVGIGTILNDDGGKGHGQNGQ